MAISVKHRSLLAGAGCLMMLVSVPINATDAVANTGHRPDVRATRSRHQSITINEKASLHLVGLPGRVVHERGRVSGLENGTCISQTETLSNVKDRTTITVVTHRGSFTVTAITLIGNVLAPRVSYNGMATVTGGTGRWAHASGHLKISGTVDRRTFQMTAYIQGYLVA